MNNTSVNLDDAKRRLKAALTRLEETVEGRIKEMEEKTRLGAGSGELAEALQKTEKELGHLRDENQNLQTMMGQGKEEVSGLKSINRQVSARIDGLITDLKAIVE